MSLHKGGGLGVWQSLKLSWPDVFRPSTTCFQERKKDVDDRHKGGHDNGGLGNAITPIFVANLPK